MRRLLNMIAADRRVSATGIQAVGSKGYNGFVLARVIAMHGCFYSPRAVSGRDLPGFTRLQIWCASDFVHHRNLLDVEEHDWETHL
jgi:hypothetical protein